MANIWNPTPARILQGLLSDQIRERGSHESSIRHAQIDIKSCNMRIDALSQAIRALGETPDVTAYHCTAVLD